VGVSGVFLSGLPGSGVMNLKSKTVLIFFLMFFVLLLISLYTFIYRLLVVSVVGQVIVFAILYRGFGKLMRGVIERDERLQHMNKQLGQEIAERREIEKELVIHRDHLETLILEGTTELEIKNQEIEASEKKFRIITASIRDAIIMIDRDGRVSFWNNSACRIFGYSAEEVHGETLYKLIVPDPSNQKAVDAFEIFKMADTEKAVEEIIEAEARRKNGEIFPIEITLSIVDIQGMLHTIAFIRDVSRKKEEERERHILSSAVEQSNVVTVLTDSQGIIQYVNPRFTEVTGYSKEEALGQNPHFLNSGIHKVEFYRDLWETITSGNDWRGEFYNKKKNGELYWESSQISPIKDSRGTITHFVAFKEDVTERKRMEIELRAAKKAAEEVSRSKSEFLANMSHELRTPMNAIIGMTELALDTRVTEEQQEYLNIVRQSSNSLLSLLNDILDLSKIEAGKLILDPIPFNLRESLGETARTLGHQAHKKKLELVYYIDSEVPEQLIGDVGRLRQVIINLIGNSIKFTEEGEIVLKIEISETLPDDKIVLHCMISDTGIGIPQEKQETIFEKFSQADTSTTRRYGGSGLGLPISASLINLMEGTIWVESPTVFPHFCKSGPGSTFHFTASFSINRSVPDTRRAFDFSKLKGLPILIVDDNKTNRRFLQEVFFKYGLEPEEASSGKEALRLLDERTFQLIILDYLMPDMDGGMVLEKLRVKMRSDIPVILISSGTSVEELDRFRRMGISAHFFKPVNTRDLLDAIVTAMGFEIEERKGGPVRKEDIPCKEQAGISILVAEDNPINQRLVKRLLEKRGYTVDIAANGNEAVNMFKYQAENANKPYRLIFMDIQMPVMDGIEATREIRRNDGNIPIIALTAYAMKDDRVKFLSQGMTDYISKPIKKTLLFELVDKYTLHLHPGD
jgi:two-component system sensor histidine kinase/response regulator